MLLLLLIAHPTLYSFKKLIVEILREAIGAGG
jgi:hypothetical protein